MSRDDYMLAVAAMNGSPKRLVTLDRNDGVAFRDYVDVGSSKSRRALLCAAACKFAVEESDLAWLDDTLMAEADIADARADVAVADVEREERKSQATQLVELAAGIELFQDSDREAFARFGVE